LIDDLTPQGFQYFPLYFLDRSQENLHKISEKRFSFPGAIQRRS